MTCFTRPLSESLVSALLCVRQAIDTSYATHRLETNALSTSKSTNELITWRCSGARSIRMTQIPSFCLPHAITELIIDHLQATHYFGFSARSYVNWTMSFTCRLEEGVSVSNIDILWSLSSTASIHCSSNDFPLPALNRIHISMGRHIKGKSLCHRMTTNPFNDGYFLFPLTWKMNCFPHFPFDSVLFSKRYCFCRFNSSMRPKIDRAIASIII